MPDPRLGEEHGDAGADTDEPGRQLGADEAAADHGDVGALACGLADEAVVVKSAEPDDSLRSRNLPWARARRQQELLPLVLLAGVCRCAVRV